MWSQESLQDRSRGRFHIAHREDSNIKTEAETGVM